MSTKQGKGKSPTQKIKDKLDDLLKQAEEFENRRPELEAKAEDKISYAKTKIMKQEPFFAMLLFKMPVIPCYQIKTMATEGTHILYNPVFVADELLRKDVLFVLMHEICHVFFRHHIRGPIKGKEAQKILDSYYNKIKDGKKDVIMEAHVKAIQKKLAKWNNAADYVINYHLRDELKFPCSDKLKEEMLYDKQYKNTTSEVVYKALGDDPEGDGDGNEGMGIGGILPAGLGDLTEQEITQLGKDLEQDVKAAAISAKKAGKLPKGMQELIEGMYTTTTPWQDVFRTIFTQISKQDYTFRFPNKRYSMHQANYGVIMPSVWGEEYTDAYFIMDTSGSVGPREKKILTSELRQILEDYPIRLHVIYCDTKAYIENIEVLTREDIQGGKLKLDVKGGGGTDMRPAFNHINNNLHNVEPEVVICMTDMYLSSWDLGNEPSYNVYWAQLPRSNKSAKPPWGVKIDIQLEKE